MSASREKKERVGGLTDGMTQKQRKEAEEAKQQKKNKTIYTIIGVVVAIAVAALLIWDSPLVQRPATAAVVDGQEFSSAELSYFYQSAFQNYYYTYARYAAMGLNIGYDFNKPASEQNYSEGKTWQEYFQEQALDYLRQVVAMTKAAEAEGYTISEEGQAIIDNDLKQLDAAALQNGMSRASYLKGVYGRFMTNSIYTQCLERAALASDYALTHEKSLTYDDAALEAYYAENKDELDTFVYDYAYFYGQAEGTETEDGETVEPTEEESKAAMEAAKAKADKLAEDVKAGGSFETLAAAAIGDDDSSSKGVDQVSLGSALSSSYKEWLQKDHTKGDVTVIEVEDKGYYVVRFQERMRVEDDYATADFRHILIKAELGEDDPDTEEDESKTPTEEAMNAAKAEAQALLDQWKAGDKTVDSFAALANEHSDDPGSNTNGGLYEGSRRAGLVPSVGDWLFDGTNKVGDAGLVENTNSGQQGWHVMYLENIGLPTWKDTATNDLKTEAQTEWMDSLVDPVKAEKADGMSQVGK